jgi:hypothetical protein
MPVFPLSRFADSLEQPARVQVLTPGPGFSIQCACETSCAMDFILSPLRNHRHVQPSKKPVQPKFSFPLGQFCGGQLLRLLQSVSGIQFDIRLDPRAFPIGLGNGIHRAREWHSNHEVIVNAMP